MKVGVPLVEVTRRDRGSGREVVESLHAGHLVVTGADGEVLAALGDPEVVTYARSTAKPFQATACLELLALSGGDLSAAEVAVAWSSHRGEPVHLDAVRRLLRRSATRPADLTCPPVPSEHDPGAVPAPILNGCSGKHALFALAGMHQGTERPRLLDPDEPLQRVVLGVLAEALGPPAAVGRDGCGAPAVAVPLVALARAYAAVRADARWQRVRDAGFARPDLVGGEGRVETALLDAGVVAKPGAEGVFAAAWQGRDGAPRGLAIKCADGAQRGTGVAVHGLLTELGVIDPHIWRAPAPVGGTEPAGVATITAAVRDLAVTVPDAR